MTRLRSAQAGLVAVIGASVLLAGCSASNGARSGASTTIQSEQTSRGTDINTASEPSGGPITLEESVPNSAVQPEGIFKVVAGTINRSEIDGVTALRALFSVYPPQGIELDADIKNPQLIADGDEVSIGSCTYRFDINEVENTVTLVPVEAPSPGACGAD